MARHGTKQSKRPSTRTKPAQGSKPRQPRRREETPPGATRKALERPLEAGGGPPGSAAGPRHASDDVGSEVETVGRMDSTITPASPPREEEPPLEKGPPYSGRSGGAVGGTPAQLRSSEGTHSHTEPEETQTDAIAKPRIPPTGRDTIRLTGAAAIEYAEKQGLRLNKHPDSITGPRQGLNIGEAQAIADDDPDLIWLDVAKEDYYTGPLSDYEPEG